MYRPHFLVRMKSVSLNPIAATLLFLAFGFLGCENLVSPDSQEPTPTASQAYRQLPKFRFSHLLNVNRQNSLLTSSSPGDTSRADLIIGFADSTILPNKLLQRYGSIQQYKLLQRYDGSIQYSYGMSARIEHYDGDFEAFLTGLFADWQNDADISWFEPDIDIDQDDPGDEESDGSTQIVPWGVQDVGYTTADVSNVHLYVIDSGVHNEDVNLVEVKYFGSDSLQALEDNHGYFIAGAAGAIDNASGIVGVAPGVPVHSFVVTDANGLIQLSTVVQALDEIVSRKNATPSVPMVVNISLGTDVQSTAYNALDEAVEAASSAGVVVVVAAGNEGKDAATISPAHAASAITVGAYDATDDFAWFSNYGASVDILAPGVNIESLNEGATGGISIVINSGTSMAAPHAGGTAVVHLADNPADTPAEVLSALLANARDEISGMPTGTTNKAVHLDD